MGTQLAKLRSGCGRCERPERAVFLGGDGLGVGGEVGREGGRREGERAAVAQSAPTSCMKIALGNCPGWGQVAIA